MTGRFLIRPEIVDAKRRRAAIECMRTAQVSLPTWSELADPARMPALIEASLKSVGPDEPDGRNLWRGHWVNRAHRRTRVPPPGYIVLAEALTRVKAPIVVLFGRPVSPIRVH